MKILIPGREPEKKVYGAICSYCKCVFEYEEGEARFTPYRRDGVYLSISCPTCQRSVVIAKSPT